MVLWRDLWAKAIATPMDATVGCLWAEGVADEILLFWQGQRLLALLSPIGLTIAGGSAGILQPSLAGVLPGLPIVAALHFCVSSVSRTVPRLQWLPARNRFTQRYRRVLARSLVMLTARALTRIMVRAYFLWSFFLRSGRHHYPASASAPSGAGTSRPRPML